ncbi:dhhc zinc finger domain containing protein [Stylonychia lemnae]|uniref:Dhhc zinc finger domain containing protein n=1 Tax=Stylonychia lemnae TaxID=5949 RepID=A0A078ATS3_STYLE|nr:dhhc zinc finger domain containing protein [Stylonychia lemnae]|eukprot:CDW85825.1 dhhc zinc finger domain containing protein [Stylonychia lemnae]
MSEQRQSNQGSPDTANLRRRNTSTNIDHEIIHPESRVNYERFDSTSDDRKDEKLVFKYIQRVEIRELQRHLIETETRFEIIEIYDRSGYSPLHFAAYKNNEKMAEILCLFVLGRYKNTLLDDNERIIREATLKEWVNKQSRGDEGFTPLHFASFHGNIQLIRMLMKYGANIEAKNKLDINMLHVAAQGDQPASLNFFRLQGLDINSRDRKQSTPLHWAAFSGAELALSYILAWEAEDNDGKTPLDMCEELRTPAMRIEIKKLLLQNGGLFNDIFMIKPPLRKTVQSRKTLFIFLSLMVLSYFALTCFIFPKIDNFNFKLSILITFAGCMVFSLVSWLKDPGYLLRDQNFSFMDLLEQFEPNGLCPDCLIIRTPRSLIITALGSIIVNDIPDPSIQGQSNEANNTYQGISNQINNNSDQIPGCCPFDINQMDYPMNDYISFGVQCAVCCFSFCFIFPLGILVLIQSINFASGETTVERLGKKSKRNRNSLINTPRKKLTIEYSLMEEEINRDRRSCLLNCSDMLWRTRVLSQQEILLQSRELHEQLNGV